MPWKKVLALFILLRDRRVSLDDNMVRSADEHVRDSFNAYDLISRTPNLRPQGQEKLRLLSVAKKGFDILFSRLAGDGDALDRAEAALEVFAINETSGAEPGGREDDLGR